MVTLYGSNTYNGTTTVESGTTLKLESADALGATSGITIVSGSTLDVNYELQYLDMNLVNVAGSVINVASPPVQPTALQHISDGLIQTAPGADGGNPTTPAMSGAGVVYANGQVALADTELSSEGFGTPWGQELIWTNQTALSTKADGSPGVFGSGMISAQLPHLLQFTTIRSTMPVAVVVVDGANALWFDFSSSHDRALHGAVLWRRYGSGTKR